MPALLLTLILARMPAVESFAQDQRRPSVGEPLREARELMAAGHNRAALALIEDAEGVGEISPYERSVIHQMRGAALSGAGDPLAAVDSFTLALAAGKLPSQEALRIMEGIVATYLRARKYPEAIIWIKKYRAEGGSQEEILNYLPQAYYLAADEKAAAREASAMIRKAERAGTRPAEAQFELLAASLLNGNALNAYLHTLERMLQH